MCSPEYLAKTACASCFYKLLTQKYNFFTPTTPHRLSVLLSSKPQSGDKSFSNIKHLTLKNYVLYDQKDIVYLMEKQVGLKELSIQLGFSLNFIIKKYDPHQDITTIFRWIKNIPHHHHIKLDNGTLRAVLSTCYSVKQLAAPPIFITFRDSMTVKADQNGVLFLDVKMTTSMISKKS